MGDALAVAVLEARGFTAQDFARSHPGGALGRKLLLHVEDLMRTGTAVPRVTPDAPLSAGLLEMSRKGLGMTVVVDRSDRILGVFTDGDLRRALDKQIDVHATVMSAVMTQHGKTIGPRELAAEAVHLMEVHQITALPVADAHGRLIGALNVHDLCGRAWCKGHALPDGPWCAPFDCWCSTSTACSPTGGCISARAARRSRCFTCATGTASCSCAAPGSRSR